MGAGRSQSSVAGQVLRSSRGGEKCKIFLMDGRQEELVGSPGTERGGREEGVK